MEQLYTTKDWEDYVKKVEDDFQLKTYPQFDPYFDFTLYKEKLHKLVSDSTFKSINSYDFTPFLKVLVKTPRYKYQEGDGIYDLETKIRPILFASHFDTYIYGFYAFVLNRKYQEYIHHIGIEEAIMAYRSDLDGKCNIQFANETFDEVDEMVKKHGECSVIALDIKGYFDHIDHKKLKEAWCKVIGEPKLPPDQYHVFRSLTKYAYVNYVSFLKHFRVNLRKLEKEQKRQLKKGKGYQSLLDLIPDTINGAGFKNKMNLLRKRKLVTINSNNGVLKTAGIPQGSSMSAVLSNVYLVDFDKQIVEKGKKEGFLYRRYCDDLLIICRKEEVNRLKDYLMNLISNDYKLIIQDKKTAVVDFKRDTLGKIRSFKREYNKTAKTFDEVNLKDAKYKNLQYLGFEYSGQKKYIRASSLSRYFRKQKARVVKTVTMAYSKNSKSDIIYKQQIFSRYSHFGKRNFLTYAYNASKKYYYNSAKDKKFGMDSPSIRRQLAAHMRILKQEIEKTSEQRAKQKGTKIIKK
ncbi:reverse transcriptase domain-containing protein [Hanstruepera flava]|uniref:reverse transcriptase domain-containing protein n=1 Tax=Hanstruepera flava TaxID=2930218 RepID=UPI002027B84C|nr:reverse transcriptase domain-containing protein [Hanstruepera flava]